MVPALEEDDWDFGSVFNLTLGPKHYLILGNKTVSQSSNTLIFIQTELGSSINNVIQQETAASALVRRKPRLPFLLARLAFWPDTTVLPDITDVPQKRKFAEITLDTPLRALSRFFEWNSAALVTQKEGGDAGWTKPVAELERINVSIVARDDVEGADGSDAHTISLKIPRKKTCNQSGATTKRRKQKRKNL